MPRKNNAVRNDPPRFHGVPQKIKTNVKFSRAAIIGIAGTILGIKTAALNRCASITPIEFAIDSHQAEKYFIPI